MLVGVAMGAAEMAGSDIRPEQRASSPAVRTWIDEALDAAAGRIRAGANSDAEGLLLPILQVNPANRPARYLLGMARFRGGDFVGAEQVFRILVESTPNDANGQYGLGVSLMKLGQLDEAAVALEAALRARPDFAEAQRKLMEVRAGSPSPGSLPQPGSGWTSLAEMLDVRGRPPLDDDALAGNLRWTGRPIPLSLVPAVVAAVVVVLAPRALRALINAVPAGSLRDLLAQFWRLAAAISLPLAVVILTGAAASWLVTRYVLCERRLEVTKGILRRRHVVVWFHEMERQAVVQQTLLEMLVGLGSIVLVTEALLASRAFFGRPPSPGKLVLRGLLVQDAYQLAAVIRRTVLVERRRMIQSFITNR